MRISNNLQLDEADEIIYDVDNSNESFFVVHKILLIFTGIIIALIGLVYYASKNSKKNHNSPNYQSNLVNDEELNLINQENINNNSLRFTQSIELMTPITDTELKQLKDFGSSFVDAYPLNHIGRLWFTIQHKQNKTLLVNIIKAKNLPSLFYQNEPSTFIRAKIIVNGCYDKNEQYDTQVVINNRDPMFFEAFYIPLNINEIAKTVLCLHVYEIHPMDYLSKKKLGSVYYPLDNFAYQTCDSRFIWRDLMLPNLNQKQKRKNEAASKKVEDTKPFTLHCDTELVYSKQTKILKIIIYNIMSENPNGETIFVRINGYIQDQRIFQENGPKCTITKEKNIYDTIFEVELFEKEIPLLRLHFELLKYTKDKKEILFLEFNLDHTNIQTV